MTLTRSEATARVIGAMRAHWQGDTLPEPGTAEHTALLEALPAALADVQEIGAASIALLVDRLQAGLGAELATARAQLAAARGG